ncbi:MAG TPA: pantetheine-phosphate adenylyltransferase [Bacteroidia bacterium]|nr:pantetheine-phosphate adenylyltransferase [Bacteroidia bacterium]
MAVFPGSFDPITIGHESIIYKALPLFDELIIAIGINAEKKYFFSLEKRILFLEQLFKKEPKIKIKTYKGLTVDFCEQQNAKYIVRGLRTAADFEFERSIAQMNKAMNNSVETVFFISNPEFSAITSTIVREIIRYDGDVKKFIPKGINLK